MKRFLIAALMLCLSLSAHAATLLPNGKQCFSAVNGTTGMVGLLGTITGGTLYTTGTYGGVPLTGGTGSGATATIVVAAGAVTSVTIQNPGSKYTVADVLSAAAANIGGTGAGFAVPVSSVSINGSLAGGQVFMYIPATTTPKQTWQDAAQTILNSTPIVLDANGCAIIYGSGTYRQLLQDSLGNTVWDQLTTDTSGSTTIWAGLATNVVPNTITVTAANFNGADGQTIAFIAALTNTSTATLNPSSFGNIPIVRDTSSGPVPLVGGEIAVGNVIEVIYDATNVQFHMINGVSTQTVSASNVFPQGYLTPCPAAGGVGGCTAGILTPTGDVTATTMYYTPAIGNSIPIWNGSIFVTRTFAEMSLALSGSQTGSNIYDTCVFNNAGTLVLVTAPNWTTPTAGLGARGAAAALTRINGIWVNNLQITGINGASNYTIPANQCTYVGSLFIDAAAGQVSFHRTYGQSRKWGAWNAYNRLPIFLQAGDPAASWTYNSITIRSSNNNAANTLTIFSGLAEEQFDILFSAQSSPVPVAGLRNGIGYNSTTAFSGTTGVAAITGGSGVNLQNSAVAFFTALPALGINQVNALEALTNGGLSLTIFGQQPNMLLSAKWRG